MGCDRVDVYQCAQYRLQCSPLMDAVMNHGVQKLGTCLDQTSTGFAE
jgi:hypothetical protein